VIVINHKKLKLSKRHIFLAICSSAFSMSKPEKPQPPLQFSSSNKMKIGYAQRIGCASFLPHDGKEIQGSPAVVAHEKCITAFEDAKKERGDAVDGLFIEDTAVAPCNVCEIIGAYASSFVRACNITGLSLYDIFEPFFKVSTACIYSSTVCATFDGKLVITITCKVECECVPERKGKGGRIDACMIPLKIKSLTLKVGDAEEEILIENQPIDSDGKTYSQREECCKDHPRTIAFGALDDQCSKNGWVLM
jgi:hypothetical protein